MSTEMLMKNRERFIKNVNSNENGAAALSLRLFCYARSMAVKNRMRKRMTGYMKTN